MTVEAPHPAHTGPLAFPGRHASRLALRHVAVGPDELHAGRRAKDSAPSRVTTVVDENTRRFLCAAPMAQALSGLGDA